MSRPSQHNRVLARRGFLQASLLTGSASLAAPLHLLAQDTRGTDRSAVVDTSTGQVRGLRFADGVNAFYGIPYGAPTTGAQRFAAPAAPEPWTGIRDTVSVGNRSPQTTGGPIPEVFALDRREPMGEDCLNINVFTPATDAGKRPVMVWLHGGGYTSGSGGWLLYDGSALAASQDVVVVTVSHRLNVFGYLYLADLGGEAFADSGNAGMLDIIAVLEWVRDNIAGFGGDPDSVTLFGQSGGAGKVSTLLAMPAAKGLFHKAIAMSGAALSGIPATTASATAERFLAALDLNTNQLDQLRQLPTRQLLDAYLNTPGLGMAPVLDGHNLPADPFTPGAPALSAQVPMIMGTTAHEINFFPSTPLEPVDDARLLELVRGSLRAASEQQARDVIALYRGNRPEASNVELYQLIASDAGFRGSIITQAERKADQGAAPLYLYYFTWPSPVREGKLRAYHCLDIPFAFNNVDNCAAMVGARQDRYALASRMSTAFANFARGGNPNHDQLPRWLPFDTSTRPTMVLDNEPQLVNDPYGAERKALLAI